MSENRIFKFDKKQILSPEIHFEIIQACIEQDIPLLSFYQKQGISLDSIRNQDGDTLLHLAIMYDKPESFAALLEFGLDANNRSDFDGIPPLTFAMFSENPYYFDQLLKIPTLDVNIPSEYGATPLLFAYYEQNNVEKMNSIISHPSFDATFNQILINEFNIPELTNYLDSHQIEPDHTLVELYTEVKLFGLKYDFDNCFELNHLQNHQYACFSYEGYSNQLGIQALNQSFGYFYDEIISSSHIPFWANETFEKVNDALMFSAHTKDPYSYYARISSGEAALIPSGWDGHSVFMIIHGNSAYRCNRGDMSDGIHGIEEFIITKPWGLTPNLVQLMIDAEGSPDFLQYQIIDILGLEKVGEIENPTQIAGNCVWTSGETGVEGLFLTHFIKQGIPIDVAHTFAKESFTLWESYDLLSSLSHVIEHKDIFIENTIYDDLLIKALTTHHNPTVLTDLQIGALILNELNQSTLLKTFDKEYHPFLNAADAYQHENMLSVLSIEEILKENVTDSLNQLFDSYTPPSLPSEPSGNEDMMLSPQLPPPIIEEPQPLLYIV